MMKEVKASLTGGTPEGDVGAEVNLTSIKNEILDFCKSNQYECTQSADTPEAISVVISTKSPINTYKILYNNDAICFVSKNHQANEEFSNLKEAFARILEIQGTP
jgi:hypothetical protein